MHARAREHADTAKTGRTHLMDAVPMTLGQELSGWAAQVEADLGRLSDTGRRLLLLAHGGTALTPRIGYDLAGRIARTEGRDTATPARARAPEGRQRRDSLPL